MFDWPAIYADFKASGYTCIRKYYAERLPLIGTPIPALATVYERFRQLKRSEEAAVMVGTSKPTAAQPAVSQPAVAPQPSVSHLSSPIRVVDLGDLKSTSKPSPARSQAASVSAEKPLTITLPGGTRLEFLSTYPELLAANLIRLAEKLS